MNREEDCVSWSLPRPSPSLPTRVLVSVFSYEMQSLDSAPSEQAFLLACTSWGRRGGVSPCGFRRWLFIIRGDIRWGPGQGRIPPRPLPSWPLGYSCCLSCTSCRRQGSCEGRSVAPNWGLFLLLFCISGL